MPLLEQAPHILVPVNRLETGTAPTFLIVLVRRDEPLMSAAQNHGLITSSAQPLHRSCVPFHFKDTATISPNATIQPNQANLR